MSAAQTVKKPYGRFGGAQTRNLNRRGGRWPRPPLVSVDSFGSLCASRKCPQGTRFPPSPPNEIRTQRHARWVRKPCKARFPYAVSRPGAPQGREGNGAYLSEKIAAGELFRHAERRTFCPPRLETQDLGTAGATGVVPTFAFASRGCLRTCSVMAFLGHFLTHSPQPVQASLTSWICLSAPEMASN